MKVLNLTWKQVYLLKPIRFERFLKAVNRIIELKRPQKDPSVFSDVGLKMSDFGGVVPTIFCASGSRFEPDGAIGKIVI